MITYGWQCPHCNIQSGFGFSKLKESDSNPDPPICCYGDRMVAFRIPKEDSNDNSN